ncbi:growth arrest and DNA damage-inducible protein GADD45 gamma [Aplysia californica]|uniref:Growth arrest and DNA damage-inducible protein GADD45 gamma n=1 Tax=Aplysia californica TaxID=6500 RepID=A0ABM1AC17_APLCA|nr:growth arrest and DNA damage-inducible protein GADD45 gamma [Aplysia californica]
MTLTDRCDSVPMDKNENYEKKETSMGDTLREVVWQAQEQGRLTCGVNDCAQLLEVDPYNVMLCVLPEAAASGSEVSLHIHHMLIEAFCREYDIRLVKVDSLSKMSDIVKGRTPSTDNCVKVTRSSAADTSCLIVQYPSDGTSEEDEVLAEYYKNVIFSDSSQTCVISLPD